jgi:hypothetical protein
MKMRLINKQLEGHYSHSLYVKAISKSTEKENFPD